MRLADAVMLGLRRLQSTEAMSLRCMVMDAIDLLVVILPSLREESQLG